MLPSQRCCKWVNQQVQDINKWIGLQKHNIYKHSLLNQFRYLVKATLSKKYLKFLILRSISITMQLSDTASTLNPRTGYKYVCNLQCTCFCSLLNTMSLSRPLYISRAFKWVEHFISRGDNAWMQAMTHVARAFMTCSLMGWCMLVFLFVIISRLCIEKDVTTGI